MGEKTKDFLKQNIGYIVVFLTCAVYIASAIAVIDETGKTIRSIIADGAISFFLGMFITRAFDLQGLISGDADERVRNTISLHGETVTRISPYIDKLDDWCNEQNKIAYKSVRTKILARAGLKYKDCFDSDGAALPVEFKQYTDKTLKKIEKNKRHIYYKAVKLKLTPISAGDLTSENGKKDDPFYFGRTKEQYEKQSSIMEIISKIGTACIFGYYGVKLLEDFSYADMVWKALQVSMFVIMGIIKMYQSKMFITDEFRSRIIKKIDNLQKFENYIVQGENCNDQHSGTAKKI